MGSCLSLQEHKSCFLAKHRAASVQLSAYSIVLVFIEFTFSLSRSPLFLLHPHFFLLLLSTPRLLLLSYSSNCSIRFRSWTCRPKVFVEGFVEQRPPRADLSSFIFSLNGIHERWLFAIPLKLLIVKRTIDFIWSCELWIVSIKNCVILSITFLEILLFYLE